MTNYLNEFEKYLNEFDKNLSEFEGWMKDKLDVSAIEKMAYLEADNSELKGELNGPNDAYRHMIVTAEMARRKGPVTSTTLGLGHELTGLLQGQPLNQAKMDASNNAIGVDIGMRAKTLNDVIDMARKAMQDAISVGGTGKNGTPSWIDHDDDKNWPKDLMNMPRVTAKTGYAFAGLENKAPSYSKRLGLNDYSQKKSAPQTLSPTRINDILTQKVDLMPQGSVFDKVAAPAVAAKQNWVPEAPTTATWGQKKATKPKPFSIRSLPGIPENSIVAGARKKAREMLGKASLPSVDADANLGTVIDGTQRIGAVLNGPELTQRQMAGTIKTTASVGKQIGTKVGALVDRATVDKLMRSAAYSNPQHPEHETVANTVRGYFAANSPATVTTPDDDPALWSGVQAQTYRNLAAQVKADAKTEAATNAANKAAAAQTAKEAYGPPTLAQFKAKQTTLGQQGAGQSLLEKIGAPQTLTLKSTYSLKGMQAAVHGASGVNINGNGGANMGTKSKAGISASTRKTSSNMSQHGNIDAARGASRRAARAASAVTPGKKGKTGGVGTLNKAGHLTHIDGVSVKANQANIAKNLDGSYSLDKDGKGSGDAGGTVICTELFEQGLLPRDVYMVDQRYGLRLMRDDPYVMSGYHFLAKPVVKLMRRSRLFTHILNRALAEAWAKEMVVREGLNGIGTLRGKVLLRHRPAPVPHHRARSGGTAGLSKCFPVISPNFSFEAWLAPSQTPA